MALFILLIVGTGLISLWASARVKGTYARYSQVEASSGVTGAEFASAYQSLGSQVVTHSGQLSGIAQPILDDEILTISTRRFRTVRELVWRPKFLVGLTLFAIVALMAIFAPLVARYNPNAPDFLAINQNPTSAHILGTDYLGRDMWARLCWGGRTSLPGRSGGTRARAAARSRREAWWRRSSCQSGPCWRGGPVC